MFDFFNIWRCEKTTSLRPRRYVLHGQIEAFRVAGCRRKNVGRQPRVALEPTLAHLAADMLLAVSKRLCVREASGD